MTNNLLPANATPLERALAATNACTHEVPIQSRRSRIRMRYRSRCCRGLRGDLGVDTWKEILAGAGSSVRA